MSFPGLTGEPKGQSDRQGSGPADLRSGRRRDLPISNVVAIVDKTALIRYDFLTDFSL